MDRFLPLYSCLLSICLSCSGVLSDVNSTNTPSIDSTNKSDAVSLQVKFLVIAGVIVLITLITISVTIRRCRQILKRKQSQIRHQVKVQRGRAVHEHFQGRHQDQDVRVHVRRRYEEGNVQERRQNTPNLNRRVSTVSDTYETIRDVDEDYLTTTEFRESTAPEEYQRYIPFPRKGLSPPHSNRSPATGRDGRPDESLQKNRKNARVMFKTDKPENIEMEKYPKQQQRPSDYRLEAKKTQQKNDKKLNDP